MLPIRFPEMASSVFSGTCTTSSELKFGYTLESLPKFQRRGGGGRVPPPGPYNEALVHNQIAYANAQH